jgi:hypothetical protein
MNRLNGRQKTVADIKWTKHIFRNIDIHPELAKIAGEEGMDNSILVVGGTVSDLMQAYARIVKKATFSCCDGFRSIRWEQTAFTFFSPSSALSVEVQVAR